MIKRTMYSMSHNVATASQFGRLCPTMIQEVAPGDTWSGKTGILVRLSPLKRALLADVYVDQFTFYVPHRLVMADWESFIAEGPSDAPVYSVPTVSLDDSVSQAYEPIFWNKSVPASGDTTIMSALRLYAHNLIFNEFFRDEQDALIAPALAPGTFGLAVSWKKDYWSTLRDDVGLTQPIHFADVTAGSPDRVSALEILEAIARQKIATKRATYGTRYIDILRSYGVNVNYQMLQRPELVAIARGQINVTDVVSTSNDSSAELGFLAGHGISGTRLRLKRKTFPEHGTLMSFVIVRPVQIDSNFVDWFDKPRDYQSFYDPGLVPLPPVAVTKADVIAITSNADRADLLGYQQWGNWYRSALSRTRADLTTWLGRAASDPTSWNLVELRNMNPLNFNTLFSNTDFGHYQVSAVHSLRALRALPRTNVAAGARP